MGFTKPETRRAYYEKNKEKWRTVYRMAQKDKPNFAELARVADRRSKEKRRKQILEAYGGHCVCCGECEPRFLELDHIYGLSENEKADNLHCRKHNTFGSRLYQTVVRLGFPKDKYRLLCSNCNRGRWRNGGKCPHEVQLEYGLSMC